jgi:glucuronoarabinoxylan endo-1,4-beta-xylanase
VDDLMQGGDGTAPGLAMRVLEAEASAHGADLVATSGSPAFLTVSTNNIVTPASVARVMRFTANFDAVGVYRLFARVRVGSGGASDDSVFVGAGFGAKDPTLGADWRTVNNFAFAGYTAAADVVASAGSAGTGVWKWLDLSALGGGTFAVPAGALTQTFDLAGREDGLDIDKIVFAPDGEVYTVAVLDSGVLPALPAATPVFTVSADEARQTIDGFGASSAWNGSTFSDGLSDLFFSASTGIGLSLLRVRIAPYGTTVETGTARKAIARGAKVWATPWSPPAAWKSNNDVANGGTLLPEHRADWAGRLADFALNMQAAGVPILALSAQNEPDYTAVWESCRWTPAELAAFVRDHLGPALVSRGVATRVLAAEPIGWTGLAAYGDALLGDATTRSYVSHIATHQYTGAPFAYTAPATHGKALWMTEFSDSAAESDPGMDSALRVADTIHDFFTVAQGNAWHYWWLTEGANTGSTGALTEFGTLAKRGWALGNWSRFVRPGHRRIASYGPGQTLRLSAFVAPAGRRLSIVAVNSDSLARTVPLALSGGAAPSLMPWETSAARSLGPLAPITPAADGSFTLTLPARSVTTFVTEAFNRPPSALSLSGGTLPENAPAGTVVGVVSATDADPLENFSYSLVAGEGDTDNASFALLGSQLRSTAPLDHEAGATRSIRIRVTDMAGASFERAFTIMVLNDENEYADWAASLPADQRAPELDADGDGVANLVTYALGEGGLTIAVEAAAAHLELTLPEPFAPDVECVIERSTDLVGWTPLATKRGAAEWSGEEPFATTDAEGERRVWSFAAEVGDVGRVFYRLRLVLMTSTP